MSLLVLPLYIPTLIFGAEAVRRASTARLPEVADRLAGVVRERLAL